MLAERGIDREADDSGGDGSMSVAAAPDICIVNSCTVTAEAHKKCRQLLRSIHRRWPQASIVVTGCYAQLCPDEIAAMEGVTIVAGNDRKTALAEYVDRWLAEPRETSPFITPAKDIRDFSAACSRGDRTRYFLKVQDGCDCWCTYCAIPMARGRSRSATIAEMVDQASRVAAAGGREIVITGVNIGDFGKRSDAPRGSENFLSLIRALDRVDGIERYRISSIEPDLLTDDIIDFVARSRRFMPHFHIPLQSGCDAMLRLMHRRYDTALFRSRIERIKELLPDAFIGVDIIAGMRGEEEWMHRESVDFVDSLPISRLHVFPYSERPATRALDIPLQVAQAEKHRRVADLMAVSAAKLSDFASRYVATTRPVLLEHTSRPDGSLAGFTDNYLRVNIAGAPADAVERVIAVSLDSFDSTTGEMEGHIVNL